MALNSRCPAEKFDYARRLRRKTTPSEKLLWKQIHRSLLGVRFRRQAVILGFIADFYCPSRRTIVEVDGASHKGREQYDAERDRIFYRNGITTIRFTNEEVTNDIVSCVRRLKLLIESTPHFTTNLPR